MEHYRNVKQITSMDMQNARSSGIKLPEFIDKQGKREIIEQLVDAMEYGKTYHVMIEKSVVNNGLSETVSFDLRFEKLGGY